ncbi:MAG: arginine deiminase family protein [Actinomycetota bacterium]|nr:arginine deiminase family protein [Actinomycetota bacterium]
MVRRPSSRLADGELTHLDRVPVDIELARSQWDDYVAALAANGFPAVEVDAADEHPDSVFVEDAVVVFGDLAVLTSPGAASRRGETDAVRPVVQRLGLEIAAIELPGTLDGGDVLKVGTRVYVGLGSRTNAEGIEQLRALIGPRGYDVVAVPVTRALHLKSAVTALPDGTVVGHPDLVDHPEAFDRYLPVPEPEGVAVVVLDERSVLMSSAAPESTRIFEGLGYRVVTVGISEFEKLEGCVTCLSVRVR